MPTCSGRNHPGTTTVVNGDEDKGGFGNLAAFIVGQVFAPDFDQNLDRAAADIQHFAVEGQLRTHRHRDHEAHAVDGYRGNAATGLQGADSWESRRNLAAASKYIFHVHPPWFPHPPHMPSGKA